MWTPDNPKLRIQRERHSRMAPSHQTMQRTYHQMDARSNQTQNEIQSRRIRRTNNNVNQAPLPLRPSVTMNNNKQMKCKHCKGSIIQKYDRIYCIQCSREPNSSIPQVSYDEYIQNKRGDDSVRQRINSAALERGG